MKQGASKIMARSLIGGLSHVSGQTAKILDSDIKLAYANQVADRISDLIGVASGA